MHDPVFHLHTSAFTEVAQKGTGKLEESLPTAWTLGEWIDLPLGVPGILQAEMFLRMPKTLCVRMV